MLKKTLAFGLLAAATTVSFSVPANAQNVVSGNQSIESQTVGANGSNVASVNNQDLTQVLVDPDYSNYGHPGFYPQPNIVTGNQSIDDTTVGVNGSNVLSINDQDQTNVLVDGDTGNYYPAGYPYYSVPSYPVTH